MALCNTTTPGFPWSWPPCTLQHTYSVAWSGASPRVWLFTKRRAQAEFSRSFTGPTQQLQYKLPSSELIGAARSADLGPWFGWLG